MKKLEIYWQCRESHERFKVGELFKDKSKYIFKYVDNVQKFEDNGFRPIFPFLDYTKKYSSQSIFPCFKNRLPDAKRKDIDSILKKYDLEEYDDFELLSKSEGRLPTDRLEFINPIDPLKKSFTHDFYIAGVSHGFFCNKELCDYTENIKLGYELNLVREKNNPFDKYAVRIDYKERKLGYIPKYYSEAVSKLIEENKKIRCIVFRVKSGTVDCRECIKARLIVE